LSPCRNPSSTVNSALPQSINLFHAAARRRFYFFTLAIDA
jgi:hypothetical protein